MHQTCANGERHDERDRERRYVVDPSAPAAQHWTGFEFVTGEIFGSDIGGRILRLGGWIRHAHTVAGFGGGVTVGQVEERGS